jgi:hypothetical protein
MNARASAEKAIPDGRIRSRVVRIVASLPEARTVPCGERHLSLEVRGKRFGWYLNNHHGDGRIAVNCKAPPGGNRMLVESDPAIFHAPPFVAHLGWVGIWLDEKPDWRVVQELLGTAYRLTATRKLVAMLDGTD